MKYLMAILSGFAITLGVFVGGAAFAVTYLSADPVPIQKPGRDGLVLQSGVVRVNTGEQDYERVAARPIPEPSDAAIEDQTAPFEIDEMTTAALPDLDQGPTFSPDHVAWCKERYRSYQPENNQYTPFSGGSRECVSPYLEDSANAEQASAALETPGVEAADEIDVNHAPVETFQSEHVEACFDRYRSYRPEDNSYQPYGGGPRKQCL